jgi:tRNA nucleotidyltransferase (CCA-adding enzyme)
MEIRLLDPIFSAIRYAGGRPLIVGGWVRDLVLVKCSKDLDVEVYGIDGSTLAAVLSTFGQVDWVGASFGVFKLHGLDVDFSLPRRESKTGAGHRGFEVTPDPTMTVTEAAARRDFTMNAMAYDLLTHEIIDPFGGQDDLVAGVLRHTSEHFGEDPLRVLRAFQFVGRFGLTVHADTLLACRYLLSQAPELAAERVWGEWWKWATRSEYPASALGFLLSCGWLDLYPELARLVGFEQDPVWHPEGSVWEHTLQTVRQAVLIARRDNLSTEDRGILVLAALLHDVGKPYTTQTREDGRIISPGHAEVGEWIASTFLNSIGCPPAIANRVCTLVREHMSHLSMPNVRSVRRLARRISPVTVFELARIIEADHSGRGNPPGGLPENARLLLTVAIAENVAAAAPSPILMGRHLLPLGIHPGPSMGTILRAAFDAQLDGEFDSLETGLAWLRAEEWV